ncbi:hypothetical protein AX15_005137 [Amanita polypyramis BW_CC]|nr:hypothetical protein AX15_005137 [Amanita polypyramis BW_CC]
MITHTPDSIPDTQKRRALSNAQRIAALLQGCQVLITSINLREISHESLCRALLSQHRATVVHRSQSEPFKPILLDIGVDAVKRTPSEVYNPPGTERMSPISSLCQNKFFSNILRRKNTPKPLFSKLVDVPPLVPPKDHLTTARTIMDLQDPIQPIQGIPFQHHICSTCSSREGGEGSSCVAIVSHYHALDELRYVHTYRPFPESRSPYVPLRGKWAVTTMSDPAERKRLRLQAQLDRQKEEEEAMEEERVRQALIERKKEELSQKELQDEARRKAILEEDLKRVAAERRRQEHIEKAEEERARHLLELRRRVEKEKKLEVYYKMEQWRREQLRLQEKIRRELEETKRQQSQKRLQRISQAQARHLENTSKNDVWATVQTNESFVWKRRFFKLSDGKLCLCRDAKYLSRPEEEVDICKQVRSVKEWEEGYEELEAIPNSFVMEFVKRGKTWMIYADNEEDKYVILGYMYHIARW